ncbi:DUF4760 domain-containing protein [Paludibacterium denitrificans]|uniref:DUF4760 domain-containing protein n=1 Tax=Paludibacterium denitrificans TaxID=2675226 RepID=A0A844GE16_9NEIS|nr:DUF4760 domain-containing protein [Paludibacterium denitrificans]MTD34002.1 DUF4760 domain-containing protein [Paludibacterium denitrificans]
MKVKASEQRLYKLINFNTVKTFTRPSRALGLLLIFVSCAYFIFAAWHFLLPKTFPLTSSEFNAQSWVTLTAAYAAVAGWITSSMVTIRNSIKQHTINTLLQTRLSAKYMENVEMLNKCFMTASGKTRKMSLELIASEDTNDKEKVAAVRYILNYLEFIAIGIKNGDLDEMLMKSSLRSILIGVYDISEPFIIQRRNITNPPNNRIFADFTWLYDRWIDKGFVEIPKDMVMHEPFYNGADHGYIPEGRYKIADLHVGGDECCITLKSGFSYFKVKHDVIAKYMK